ncbi:MAG TPA: GAF domain-containing protein [Ktedonobacteraceae bacterium]
MQEQSETWRSLLKTIISDPHEKQRLAEELGIKPITLSRWASSESDPRPQNLRHLLSAIPQQREQMLELIREETGLEEFTNAGYDDSSIDIPSAFYNRVFTARASTVESMRFWSLSNLILQQAISQLDPDRLGIALNVVRCMTPSPIDHKVHSLRESVGFGTHPWSGDLEQRAMFLGAESLCGYVTTLCRPAANQNVDDKQNLTPAHRVEHEKSAAVYPILFAGRIAGCLLVSSTQYNYFISQSRLDLIEDYANLIALSFEPEEFYEPQDIELRVMPDQEEQKKHFADFRQRVANTMIEGARNKRPVNNLQAEQIVWQQLEEELLQQATLRR